MNKVIPEILKTLDLLSLKLKTKLLSKQEKTEMLEQIEEFEMDLKKLNHTIESVSTSEDYTEIIAHLYQYLGDIVQDLENIHDITTKAVQQYSKKFLNDK